MSLCAIVGVGPRIGSNLARAFANEGYDIAPISRNVDNQKELVSELNKMGVSVYPKALDATDAKAAKGAFDELAGEAGVPDVVIYNPAVMPMYSFAELTPEGLQEALPVMVYGAINTVQAALPAMKKRGSGTIIFTGGGFAVEPSVPRAPHSIAKAALRNYAHGLFMELQDQGIHAGTVTVHRPIQPGEDMEKCTATFMALHKEPAGGWSWEKNYGL